MPRPGAIYPPTKILFLIFIFPLSFFSICMFRKKKQKIVMVPRVLLSGVLCLSNIYSVVSFSSIFMLVECATINIFFFSYGGKKLMKNFFELFSCTWGYKINDLSPMLCVCIYFKRVRVWEMDEGASCVSRKIINKEFEQASISKDDKP